MHLVLSGGGTVVAKLCTSTYHKASALLEVCVIKDIYSSKSSYFVSANILNHFSRKTLEVSKRNFPQSSFYFK